MATYWIGPNDDIPQITAADAAHLRLKMYDSADPLSGKTGLAAAAMTVTYCKPGESAFSPFPAWSAANWAELGGGWYDLIIRGSVAAELALLDTPGLLIFTLAAAGAVTQDVARYVVPADTAREDQWTDTRAANLDMLPDIEGTGFNTTTDSLARIREAIDALSVGGGAFRWDLTLTDKGQAVVPYCPVVVRNSTETAPIACGLTDAEGKLAFQLNGGTYKVRFGPIPGYDFSQLTDGASSGHPWTLVLGADAATTLRCNRITERFEAYTFADLRRAVLHPLEAAYKRRILKSQLELWVRAGYVAVNGRLQWHRSVYSTLGVKGQTKYNLWTQPRTIVAVTYDRVPLEEVPLRTYLRLQGEDDSEGTPVSYCQWGDDLCIHPAPDQSGLDLSVWALDPPPLLLADDDVPEYPAEYHRAIVEWALYIAYTELGNPQAAAAHLQAFELQVGAAVYGDHDRGLSSRMEVVEA